MRKFRTVITRVKMLSPNISEENSIESFDFEEFFPDGFPQRLSGLDRGSKYLLAAVKELLQGEAIDNKHQVGAAVATLFGSNSSRIRFLRGVLQKHNRIADPIAFKTTVPSVAVGALAILYQCCGPTLTCVGHGEAGLAALHNACLLIQRGMVDEMIVGGYEDLPEELLNIVPQRLRGKNPWIEGGAALLVKNETMCNHKEEKVLARICSFGLSGHGDAFVHKKNALREAMEMAIFHAGQKKVTAVISAGLSYRAMEQGMFPGIPVIDTTAMWGEALGMSGVIRLVTAVETLNKEQEKTSTQSLNGNILVNGVGISGTAYAVMLSKC